MINTIVTNDDGKSTMTAGYRNRVCKKHDEEGEYSDLDYNGQSYSVKDRVDSWGRPIVNRMEKPAEHVRRMIVKIDKRGEVARKLNDDMPQWDRDGRFGNGATGMEVDAELAEWCVETK